MSVPWYLMAKGKGGGGYKTASGPIVSVNDALAAPLRSLVAGIDPVQDLHGYDNPWPAGGGVNKLPALSAYDSTYNGIRMQIDNEGKVMLSGTSTDVASFTFDIPEITLPSTDIYIHLMNSVANSAVGIFFLFDNTSIAGLTAGALNRIYKSGALTGATINKVRYYVSAAQSVDMTLSPMLCLDGTVKAYTPYSNICPISGWSAVNVWLKPTYDPTANPTATIQLGQTVYGGTLDVTNGVLTVDRAMVDMGTLSWTYTDFSTGTYVFTTQIAGCKLFVSDTKLLCENYKQTVGCTTANRSTIALMSDKEVQIKIDSKQIYVRDSTYTDAVAFTTAMSGVQLVYELATPITIPLTPTQISTLQGQNNVWADSGDVAVEYLSSGGTDPDLMKLAVAFMGRK